MAKWCIIWLLVSFMWSILNDQLKRFSNRSHITDMCNVFSAWYVNFNLSFCSKIYPLLCYWYPSPLGYLQSKILLQWLTACLPLWPPFQTHGNSLCLCHVNAVCTFCLSLVSLVFLLLLNQHSTFKILLGSRHMPRVKEEGQTHQFLINKFSNFTFFSEWQLALPIWFDFAWQAVSQGVRCLCS